jgi:ABC-2 type transport system ATP-binding protein
MNEQPIIQVRHLEKAYGSHKVLDGIDIDVGRGTIFALLGPNGAGKTTFVNILTTLIAADRGSVTIAGHDLATHPERVRRVMSLTGQFAAVDTFQTGEENLIMMCRLAHLDRKAARARTRDLLAMFDLTDDANRSAGSYSGGMRRRLDLAISLIADPAVVVLDEPTTGLDPQSRLQLWDVVRNLAATGTTILLTTQYLEEADQLADRIAVIDRGKVVAEGTAPELKRRLDGEHIELTFADASALATAIRLELGSGVTVDPPALTMRVPATNSVQTIRDLLARTSEHDLAIANISIIKPSLDDVFLALTAPTP